MFIFYLFSIMSVRPSPLANPRNRFQLSKESILTAYVAWWAGTGGPVRQKVVTPGHHAT
jgi:hypothetical protein